MYWKKRFERPNKDEEIEQKILSLREQHKDYGYRRIVQMLKKIGLTVNHKKVQRIMKKLGLQVHSFTRKTRKYNSYRGQYSLIAPNRLNRRFDTSIPHQKVTTDTSEFKYYQRDSNGILQTKKAYLDPFMDLYNREILSYTLEKTPSAQAIMSGLREAIKETNDCLYRRTFHSDQGWGYQMKQYQSTLQEKHIFQSMSRKGNCLDNSPMENFFGLLKQEVYYGRIFSSFEELKQTISGWIHYYNHERIKEKLDWLSPVQFRLAAIAA